MKELLGSIVFQTVISGVFVFVLSELLQKFILEPVKNHKEIIAKIDNKLKLYGNIITNPPVGNQIPPIYFEVQSVLRELSCDLEVTYKTIPLRRFLSWLKFINYSFNVKNSASSLIFLSNSVTQKNESIEINGRKSNLALLASDKIDEVRTALKIESL